MGADVSAAKPRARALAIALTAIAVPALWVGFDLVTRRAILPVITSRLRWTYAAGVLLSFLVWGLGMEAARHPRRAVRGAALAFLGVTAAFGIGGQTFFRELTNGYVNRDAIMLAVGVHGIVGEFVRAHAARMAMFFLTPALLVVALAAARDRRFGHRAARPSAFAIAGAAIAAATMFAPIRTDWYQCLPPDMLWINGSGGPLLLAVDLGAPLKMMPAGDHAALPEAAPVAPDAPSIVVLLGESIRRDYVCLPHEEGCTRSPALDAGAPDRIAFPRAFSVASCTELASVALWTGLPMTATSAELARAPLLWDYAKARGYRTAYLSSQSLLFQHLDLFLRSSRIDRIREARDREESPHIDLGTPDEAATAEALELLEQPGAPAFVLVHFSNTHLPYRQAKGFTPYPTTGVSLSAKTWNEYRNSLAHHDAVVGDFMAKLRRSERGRRAVVLSLSDHGEGFGAHRSYEHSWDVFGEQVNIPVWLDAPEGSLPAEALARVRREAPDRQVTTSDLSATVLDLLGALDAPSLRDHAARLAGTSLLRPPPAARDVLLWNCPPTRECGMDAFGVVRLPLKLHYVGREAHYVCADVAADPEEKIELPEERCAALRVLLDGTFGPRNDLHAHP